MGTLPTNFGDDFEDSEYRKHSLQEGGSNDTPVEGMTLLEAIEYDLNQNYTESLFAQCRGDIKTFENIKRLFKTVSNNKITHSNIVRILCRQIYFNYSEIIDMIEYTPDIFIEGKEGNNRFYCRLDSQLYNIIDDIAERWSVSKEQITSFFVSIYVDILVGYKTDEDVKNQFELLLKHSEEHEEESNNDLQYNKMLKNRRIENESSR